MKNSTTSKKTTEARQRPQAVLDRLRELGVKDDFPLFPSGNGLWAKKVRGKLHYFGPHAEHQAALDKWLDEKEYLEAGRRPPEKMAVGLRVRDALNHFLTAKRTVLNSKEMTARSFQDYYDCCTRIAESFGKDTLVSDLRPDDFNTYREKIAAKWGPTALGNEIQRVRSVFKYCFDAFLIDVPVRFGPLFRKPKRQKMRLARAEAQPKFFDATEVKALIDAAKPQMKAMILLGINAGWGNTDIAMLQESHINFKEGVAYYPRSKTGIERRAPLWAETIAAIKEAIEKRPKAKDAADAGCVFITKYGERWKRVLTIQEEGEEGKPPTHRRSETDSVGLEFGKLLRKVTVEVDGVKVPVKKEGVNFYALRHTFHTIGNELGDSDAVGVVMGHEDVSEMGTHYQEWQKDKKEGHPRLRRVTDHVHAWLYGKAKGKRKGKAG